MEREAETATPALRWAWLRPVAVGCFFLASTAFSLNIILQQPDTPVYGQEESADDLLKEEFLVGTTTANDYTYY